MSLQETQAFFERYCDSFNRLDGDAVADLWNTPSSITETRAGDAHARVTNWTDDAPMRANMHALCDLYRRSGYRRAEFELEGHVALGADHAFANLYWRLWRGDGSLLQEFHTGYNLLRTADGPRVLMATAYEENIGAMKRHAAE